MGIKNIALQTLVYMDLTCDFIPVGSLITNCIDIVAKKSIVNNPRFMKQDGSNVYQNYLKNKDIKKCMYAAIPFSCISIFIFKQIKHIVNTLLLSKNEPDNLPLDPEEKNMHIEVEHYENYADILASSDNYEGYALKRGGVWTEFNSKDNQSEKHKIHISLDRDKENLLKSFNILFSIAKKYNIPSFKTLNISSVDFENDLLDQSNSVGKEYTIYLQDPNQQELWSQHILPEILTKFNEAGIKPGPPSTGDTPIPGGSSFFYVRSAFNSLGIYTNAEKLMSQGFTLFESANLSPNPLLNLTINNAPATEAKKLLKPVKMEIMAPAIEQIALVRKRFDEAMGNQIFFHMMVGFETKKYIYEFGNKEKITELMSKYGKHIGNFGLDNIYDTLRNARLKEEIFNPYFERSIYISAQLREYYGIQTPVGKIYPALYEHFIKNENPPIADQTKTNAIVKDLVLCLLRDGSANPAQAIQIDEELLNKLVNESNSLP